MQVVKKQKRVKKPKKPNLPKLRRRALVLWSEVVRLAHGETCELCGIRVGETKVNGKPAILNAHHLAPKESYPALRYDVRNGCCLCQNCHKFAKNSAHRGGVVFADWFRQHRADDHDYIMKSCRLDSVDTVESVLSIINELQNKVLASRVLPDAVIELTPRVTRRVTR